MAFDLRQKVFRVPGTVAVSVGLRWDFIGADPIDLDLSAVCFTAEGMLLDTVFFNHPFPQGTDEQALRSSGLLVDPQQLPYMFVSGDSRIGGEEENQLPGIALAARRREYQLRNGPGGDRGSGSGNRRNGDLKRLGITEAIFSRLYEEEELDEVEEALDENRGGGYLFDEEGRPVPRKPQREFCDESVTFVMHKIPSEADVIFLVVTSYTGADFTTLPSVKLVVFNETANERVGTIDLKHSTGNGTANLACMLCRLPPPNSSDRSMEYMEQQLWDLRELNIRTFGYTFVDVLPLMMDVLGVDRNSRDDAVKRLPDYSLSKPVPMQKEHLLSDVRFGVGWYGEHDLDAFMVLLDADNCCVDLLYPKQKRLNSLAPHAARHSGDAINGFGTVGDTEFIDLVTYRIPPEVQTILFGAIYVESFGDAAKHTKSIYDVPKLYMRLQNRTLERPNSFEIDRWNIHYEVEEEKNEASAKQNNNNNNNGEGNKKNKKQGKEQRTPRTFVGPDGKVYPIRMVVLGLMVKCEEVPFSLAYPDGRLDQQQFLQRTPKSERRGEDDDDEYEDIEDEEKDENEESAEHMVPIFEYRPLHEYAPANSADGFSSVMPYLYCIAQYRGGYRIGNSNNNNNNMNNRLDRIADPHRVLNTEHNLVDWRHSAFSAIPPSLWKEMKESCEMLMHYAVKVRFLEVRHLQPTLPHRFKCHGEAWVCNGLPSTQRPLTVFDTQPFRTPYLIHRESTQWDEKSSAAVGLFLVRRFDRIRVVIYEYASFGCVDIDLMQLEELWKTADVYTVENGNTNTNSNASITAAEGKRAFNAVEKWFPLTTTPPSPAEVRLRLFRVPTKSALTAKEKEVAAKNKGKRRYTRQAVERKEEQTRKGYNNPCSIM
ncbi:uncharacterized protein TM35_000441820 [Trypanosoma theileri]|uniref:Uncharacterized protein n=1 Tax=Trypanosoma theileri TaxID=67003 RepID=A0A1X0NIL2_9TRYP|nr:uncharacterized protein TM35_000441820 [Trypanosoma theileri]ORC84526.1 hypothetical protein TM35_000441820 [Trypanosoma theileri]